MRRASGFVWAIAALGVLLAACNARTGAPGNALRVGNHAEPDTLDPQLEFTSHEARIIGDLFEGLVVRDKGGTIADGVAESHSVSADGLVWTFKLRGETWSDGVPLTARDFVFSLRRLADPKTAASGALLIFPIKNAKAVNSGAMPTGALGVQAVDDRTLALTLEAPTPYLLEILAQQVCDPVPEHVVARQGANWTKPGLMVSNGAYVLSERVPNAFIKVVKNPRYYGANDVPIESVTYYPISDSAVELKRYEAGELDITDALPPREIDTLRSKLGAQVHLASYARTVYVDFNTTRPPFNDARVRQAVALAVDQSVIAGAVLRSGQKPALSLIPLGLPPYPNGASLDSPSLTKDARLDRARDLLAKAGFDGAHPLKFTLRYIDSVDNNRTVVVLQQMWKAIGVDASLLNSEARTHFAALRLQDFDAAIADWVADYGDAQDFLSAFDSRSGQANHGRYANTRFDALLDQAATATGPGERATILQSAERLMLTDAAIAPLYFASTRRLVSPAVRGYEDNVFDVHLARYLRLAR